MYLGGVAGFIRNVADGGLLDVRVHGDVCTLLDKTPHGPVANARPRRNFMILCKFIAAHIADQYVPLLARSRVLPCTQFTLHASSCVADLLRAPHDCIWFGCHKWRRIFMVVEDARHAYGPVVHHIVRFLLQQVGSFDVVIDILLLATGGATVHIGGFEGVCQAVLRLLAGVAEGCPWLAIVFRNPAEVRAFLAFVCVPRCWRSGEGKLQQAAAHGRYHVVHHFQARFTNLAGKSSTGGCFDQRVIVGR